MLSMCMKNLKKIMSAEYYLLYIQYLLSCTASLSLSHRYPFTVSKNHMLNVGSPHSWPILLGALSWLVDVSHSLHASLTPRRSPLAYTI